MDTAASSGRHNSKDKQVGGGGLTRYQKQLKGRQGQSSVRLQGQSERPQFGKREDVNRAQLRIEGDIIDNKFGFDRFKEGPTRVGWLLNYLAVSMPDETGMEKSAVDLYFLDRNGGNFKATVFYEPYFYVDVVDPRRTVELTQHLRKRFEGCRVEQADKEDLDMPNHLSGKKHRFLKMSFGTVQELMDAKSQLWPLVQQNQKRAAVADYDNDEEEEEKTRKKIVGASDPLNYIADMREYDVPYTMRASIDLDLRVGAWFSVTPETGSEACSVVWLRDMLELCEPKILAFDIECEKAPLKFPNAEFDRIYMISYMVGAEGFLIINREIVSKDIEDFEYTPLPLSRI